MFQFVVDTHQLTGKPMVEIWKDGKFIAAVYGHEDGIRIVSKYLDGVEHEAVIPPSLVIRFTK